MKSYTDLSQSKKLAEILPIESADMWWLYVTSQGKHIAMMYEEPDPHYIARMESYGIKDAAIRCWSLAALFNILPKQFDEYVKTLYWFDDTYHCSYENENWESKYWMSADNLIDACYKMILKLHELNLL